MDRSPPRLIAVHLQNAERPRGGCTKLLTDLFGGKNFWGGLGGVARISEAVAHGWGAVPGVKSLPNIALRPLQSLGEADVA